MSKDQPQTPQRIVIDGVALETDRNAAGTGVTFCFTERLGGVSEAPYASLNLGRMTGDDPARVEANVARLLGAVGAADLADRLVRPRQVHGDRIACLTPRSPEVPAWLSDGCDGVVCTLPDVPVLLVFADCVPVVLVAPGGFAVVHSGWRGTIAGIAGLAADRLAESCACDPSRIAAYVGPHIATASYEVSPELCERFVARFGAGCVPTERHLDLSFAVTQCIVEHGVPRDRVVDTGLDTFTNTDRFFSHRAEHGLTGRHGAFAVMRRPEAPATSGAKE